MYSHGLNRFPQLVRMIKSGSIDVNAQSRLVAACGTLSCYRRAVQMSVSATQVNASCQYSRTISWAEFRSVQEKSALIRLNTHKPAGLVWLNHSFEFLGLTRFGVYSYCRRNWLYPGN